MATKLADEFAVIRQRMLEIEASAQLVRALQPGVTLGPPRQAEPTIDELRALWRATP